MRILLAVLAIDVFLFSRVPRLEVTITEVNVRSAVRAYVDGKPTREVVSDGVNPPERL